MDFVSTDGLGWAESHCEHKCTHVSVRLKMPARLFNILFPLRWLQGGCSHKWTRKQRAGNQHFIEQGQTNERAHTRVCAWSLLKRHSCAWHIRQGLHSGPRCDSEWHNLNMEMSADWCRHKSQRHACHGNRRKHVTLVQCLLSEGKRRGESWHYAFSVSMLYQRKSAKVQTQPAQNIHALSAALKSVFYLIAHVSLSFQQDSSSKHITVAIINTCIKKSNGRVKGKN